jgi:HAD superfamily hydrolase (TIGR01548 family)
MTVSDLPRALRPSPRVAACAAYRVPRHPAPVDLRLDADEGPAPPPEALLFDLDGVLVDVSRSYRRAIVETARSFGVRLTAERVAAAKRAGDANNDWVVTRRLVAAAGVDAPLDEVTRRFEALYQGDGARPGLCEDERPLCDRALLEALARRRPLGVVTGRPRRDALAFLERFGLGGLFGAVVTMEDAPAKPSPAPVRLCLERLGVGHAWLVGDTPDDVRAARAAGVVPLGVVAPGDARRDAEAALFAAGAARVLGSLDELAGLP